MTIAFEGFSSSVTDFFHFENKTVNSFHFFAVKITMLMAAWSGL
jgi:hypothetical protein